MFFRCLVTTLRSTSNIDFLRRQKPYPQELADAPGLGVAAAGRVWEIAVQDFRDVAEASGLNQLDAAVEQISCRGLAFIAVAQHPGFAV